MQMLSLDQLLNMPGRAAPAGRGVTRLNAASGAALAAQLGLTNNGNPQDAAGRLMNLYGMDDDLMNMPRGPPRRQNAMTPAQAEALKLRLAAIRAAGPKHAAAALMNLEDDLMFMPR